MSMKGCAYDDIIIVFVLYDLHLFLPLLHKHGLLGDINMGHETTQMEEEEEEDTT